MAVPKNAGPILHWTAYFWPGLPQLWNRGSWVGLLVAVGFTALTNVLLLASLVFSEWIARETQLIGYGALVLVWLLARWQTRAERRANAVAADEEESLDDHTAEQPAAERDLLFREAQGHYLANDWVSAEQILLKMLKQDARDVESRLMLATLWRHQGRSAEALRQLDRLERLEAAEPWKHEIDAERMALDDNNNEQNSDEQTITDEEDHPTDTSPQQTEAEATKDADHHDGLDQLDQRRAA